ncbi:MAG: hypothetical protein J6252_05705 [Clostridia bacterium]|nr:hypothetical protein [Clostridia bacterium]
MKAIKNALKKAAARMKSKRGETIAEVLAALLVSSLAIVTLAVMISSASSLVNKSRDGMKAYVAGENTVVGQNGSGTAGSVTVRGSGSEIIRLTDDVETTIRIEYYENGTNGSVKSYKVIE